MKSNLIAKLVLASSLAVSLACSEGLFVGAQGDYNFKSTEFDVQIATSGATSETDSDTAFGLKVGYDFDLWRLYGSYIFGSGGSFSHASGAEVLSVDSDTSDLLIGASWTPRINDKLKAIAGVYAGYSYFDIDVYYAGPGIVLSQNTKLNGLIYGARVGGIYEFNNKHEIEFGLKYGQVKYSDKETINLSPAISVDMKNVKRSDGGIFIGYNYKF